MNSQKTQATEDEDDLRTTVRVRFFLSLLDYRVFSAAEQTAVHAL